MAPKRNITINVGDGSEETLILKTDKLCARKSFMNVFNHICVCIYGYIVIYIIFKSLMGSVKSFSYI